MSWPLVKVGDVAEFIRNGLSINQSDSKEGLPITRIETIADREINLERCGYAGVNRGDSDEYLLNKGDILISHINSEKHLAKCAIFELEDIDLIHGMNLLCLRPAFGRVFPKYLFHCLSDDIFLRQIKKITKKSVNQASFTVPSFKELEIPLPPLEEQKRIAAILDKADAIRRKRQQAIKLADDFLRSVFLEMFGDPVTNPKGWKVRDFGDVCKCSQGIQVDSDLQSDFEKDGYSRFIRIVNYTQPSAPYKYIPTPESQKAYISSSDIVMVRYGATAGFVGRGTEGYLANNLFKISPSKIYDRDFLYFFLCSRYFQNILTDVKQGGAMPALNFGQLNEIKMYEPSISLQRRFSDVTKIVSSLLTRNKVSSRFPLFESLSQKAFSGEL